MFDILQSFALTVNPDGTTCGPVQVVGGQKGQRATCVDSHSFSGNMNGDVLNIDSEKQTIALAKRDVQRMHENDIQKS